MARWFIMDDQLGNEPSRACVGGEVMAGDYIYVL